MPTAMAMITAQANGRLVADYSSTDRIFSPSFSTPGIRNSKFIRVGHGLAKNSSPRLKCISRLSFVRPERA